MKTHESANDGNCINGFKHFSDLAVEYFPDLSTPSSASRKLRNCIRTHKELAARMTEAGYTKKTNNVSPKMQLILIEFLGTPVIKIPPTNETAIESVNADKK